ncbi:MAG: TonB-dependent receptor [Bryobacteraceae bacterium]|nr:TonB-dependent receptor [Bryobacterales bacterium]MEB2362683.1 TonB-dependent receptor [Bryobacterales bacterium]NUN00579.1 TonB-dependent receptor [Bryobacteraceae bacterium]
MKRVILSFLLVSGVAFSQDYRAKVQGVVTDPTTAAVPDAKVTLQNDNTGVASTRTTNTSGQYLFDYVEPGTYTVSVEAAGFARTIQRNVTVQVRGDVTVNLALTVGAVAESITVEAAPVAVQFNTTSRELTIDRKLISELPIIARNPFTLALLDPAVVNDYGQDRYPYFMWSSSQIDVGGSTSGQNDLLLDGVPIQLGKKGSYSPPMDSVQEFTVQQNAVDAEFGHSAGGTMSLSMKSGTNEFHGTAYYFGRNPKLNAVANSVTRRANVSRNHIAGGTLGGPVLRNRLFNFVTYERWKTPQSLSTIQSLPTELERSGDFSRSLTAAGAMRIIYDPWTTQFDAAANRATRLPFAGNVIPSNRIDPTSRRVLQDLWMPNSPPDDPTGLNNFKLGFPRYHRYWNFSDRADWNINDRWRIFGRYSRFLNDYQPVNYGNSPAVPVNGGIMASRSMAFDSVYSLTQRTILNVRFGYTSLEDDLDTPSTEISEKELESFWPGNPWYKSYTSNLDKLYYPQMIVGGSGGLTFGRGAPWLEHPSSYSYHGKVSHAHGIHQLKAGFEGRRAQGIRHTPYPFRFEFSPNQTADTFIAPDTRLRGHPWASFLLGALEGGSRAQYISSLDLRSNFYGGYVQDDIRLTRNITVNLGLRYELETGLRDTENRVSRYLDLTNPIPEMQATPPSIPDSVRSLNNVAYVYNGAWIFTDDNHPNAYKTPKDRFMPRAGIAIRVNDQTAVRIGFARYVIPAEVVNGTLDTLPTYGFNASTNVEPVLQGVPGAVLSNPFPASNPLIQPLGRTLGRYQNLGDAATWLGPELHTGVNDRINFSLQRQLPAQIVADATFFMNYGRDLGYSKQLNMMDPALSYTYKAELSRSIANPFYQYLTPDKFPGQARNRQNVTVGSLLVPYPQYGTLTHEQVAGRRDRYRALQLRLQRSSASGYTFLWAYNYNRQRTDEFFNSDDQYAERFTLIPSNNPRHRMTLAGTYELPFGRGRRYMGNVHSVVNGIFGGWSLSSIYTYASGPFVRFGQMIVNGDPRIDNPTRERWFDTSVFARAAAFTPRTNPWQYEGVTGPRTWNVDMTLAKFFPITERVRIEFRMESYNVTNSFIPNMPNASVLSSAFGRSSTQGNLGREFQYNARIHF